LFDPGTAGFLLTATVSDNFVAVGVPVLLPVLLDEL
jgi:hypothetical protein